MLNMNIIISSKKFILRIKQFEPSENYLINHVIKNAGEDLFDALKELLAGKSVEETITGNSSNRKKSIFGKNSK